MKASTASVVAALAFVASAGAQAHVDDQPLWAGKRIQGSHSFCSQGTTHEVTYDVLHTSSSDIYDLDYEYSKGDVKAIECDTDGTELTIKFKDIVLSNKYFLKWQLGGSFITAQTHGCAIPLAEQQKGLVLRRVNGASIDINHDSHVVVKTSLAGYDEVYEEASIGYNNLGTGCEEERAQKEEEEEEVGGVTHVCVGVNSANCENSTQPLPLYQNDLFSVTCEECFVGLMANFRFSLKIHGFRLSEIAVGMENATVNFESLLDIKSQPAATVGLDKDIPLVTTTPFIQFKIGPIPFALWFEAPLHVTADLQFSAEAEASGGFRGVWDIGTHETTWDPKAGWKTTHPDPKLTFTPIPAQAHASFDGLAKFVFAPSFTFHANKLFTYTSGFHPELDIAIHADTTTKQVCEDTTYNVHLYQSAELQLNPILTVDGKSDWQWGPTDIWNATGNVSSHCWPL